jgi:ATP-dependent RNA helicase SUPV3L1/SUV3
LLGCTRTEAERWIRAGRLPVARRAAVREGGRTAREPQFDPAVLEGLRGSVPEWREARAGAPPTPREVRAEARAVTNAAVARVAGLDRYAAHFVTARALNRRIIACLGPTNSGKTYLGLTRLAEAETGLALGPLRLLAHEYREALDARGVPTALSTGEERIPVPGSRHTVATVEMCPFRMPVDVAVIDEAQMLADSERGPAWTAAIMSVPARTVIVLGAPDAAPMIRRIAELCGDPLEEVRLERMGPLVAASDPGAIDDISRSDAVIAFSRREVFELRSALLRRGRSVAVVYGALGPTVRRAEARRFREGEAEVLVATDAIGMGLNIGPLRRVVFSALTKWDGQQDRPLTVQEIKQIGGRAGRFGGAHAEGIVAVLEGGGDPAAIAHALAASPTAPRDLRPPVAPDADIVAVVAAEIGTESLFGTLRRIERSVRGGMSRTTGWATCRRRSPSPRRWTGYGSCRCWTAGPMPCARSMNGTRASSGWRAGRWSMRWAARWHRPGQGICRPPAGPARRRCSWPSGCIAEVAWRWMALRFPEVYRDIDGALAESGRLNEWIEAVLATRPSGRVPALADGVVREAGGVSRGHSRRRQFGQRGGSARKA